MNTENHQVHMTVSGEQAKSVPPPLSREERIQWMAVWAAKNALQLVLEGECGIGRECVGVSTEGHYPDYEWDNPETFERLDPNGEVWTPEDAYHKHPCVAVLGRGEEAEAQLYEWLRWFDANNFVLETGDIPLPKGDRFMATLMVSMGKHRYARMVRRPALVMGLPPGIAADAPCEAAKPLASSQPHEHEKGEQGTPS